METLPPHLNLLPEGEKRISAMKVEESILINKIKDLIIEANTVLRPDVRQALQEAHQSEDNANGKKALGMLLENADIAKAEHKPICQDTGYVDIYFEWPKKLALLPDLAKVVDEAVRQAYIENNFRTSLVSDPLFVRKNTEDNTPANLYLWPTTDTKITIKVFVKGGGSDNSSAVYMLNPSSSDRELIEAVVNQVKEHGAKSCPPLVVGIGIGGSFDKVTSLSKAALWRQINQANEDAKYAALEEEILGKVNDLGIGPSGLGGKTTALAMLIEQSPCHMATLPVAVNLNCYALRTAKATIGTGD